MSAAAGGVADSKEKIERSASAALEVEVDGNVTVPLCVAFEVVIGFFSLLSEASEPITKLLGNFFVVEIFRRISWFRIKSGSEIKKARCLCLALISG